MSLSSVERAAIGWECERLVHLYAMLNDAGDFQAMAQMFTEDGRVRPAEPGRRPDPRPGRHPGRLRLAPASLHPPHDHQRGGHGGGP
ncbi:MAG: hypothetical protein WDN45_17110 [Caulobacteraceae bacterium]